jgi:hypothetical protein
LRALDHDIERQPAQAGDLLDAISITVFQESSYDISRL